jgi:hypothetical protein
MRIEDRNYLGTKKARVIVLCILNAWLFILVGGTIASGVMMMHGSSLSSVVRQYGISAAISVATATIPSLVLSLIIWPFLKQRDLGRSSVAFYVTTVVSAVVLGAFAYPATFILYGLLLIMSGIVWWVLPVVYELPGLCHRCGYDLTGNKSGTCPECGTATRQPVS